MTEEQPTEKEIPPSPEIAEPNLIKGITIKALRSTIGILEKLVAQLETEPSSTEMRQTWYSPLINFWQQVLRQIRNFLPLSLSRKLPDSILTGSIALIFLIILSTTLIQNYPKPGEIATLPPEIPIQPITPEPTPLVPPVTESPPPPVDTIAEPEAKIQIRDLKAPQEPESIALVTPPPAQLMPQQYLITSIQNQITEIVDKLPHRPKESYAKMIKLIQPNFVGSLLRVELSNNWYQLNNSAQDNLANKILEQAKKLDFTKLEIKDSEGRLIGRNPIMGNKMIILQRQIIAEQP